MATETGGAQPGKPRPHVGVSSPYSREVDDSLLRSHPLLNLLSTAAFLLPGTLTIFS
jgi:hypothetical protein